METNVFNDKDRNLYNNFLLKSKYKDILQSWEWGEVKSSVNWQTQRIGFLKNKSLVGVTQVLKKRLPFGFSLFYIPRGPIIDWADLNLIPEVLSSLKDFFIDQRNKAIFLRLEPPTEENMEIFKILEENGFKKYFKTIQPPSTLLIDLTPPEEELLRRFRRTARNLIYRSEREGIKVNVLESSQITQNDLKSFYNLYKSTGRRFSFPLRPFKQFTSLLKESSQSNIMRLYFAKIKGLTLASGIVMVFQDKAFYIWGGTGRHDYYSKFFNYGYIWGILKDLKKVGVKTFDFWGLGPENDKNHPWSGFTLFKTAFDGKRINQIGAFDLPLSKIYPIFKLADKIITPRYRATSS